MFIQKGTYTIRFLKNIPKMKKQKTKPLTENPQGRDVHHIYMLYVKSKGADIRRDWNEKKERSRKSGRRYDWISR